MASRSAVDVDLRKLEQRSGIRFFPLRDVTWPVKSRGADPDKEHTLTLTHSSVNEGPAQTDRGYRVQSRVCCMLINCMLVRMQNSRILFKGRQVVNSNID